MAALFFCTQSDKYSPGIFAKHPPHTVTIFERLMPEAYRIGANTNVSISEPSSTSRVLTKEEA
jgi:hypothetical protein